MHATGVPTPITELADAFGRPCARAADEDLRLAIEFLPDTGIPDLPTAAAIGARPADRPNGSVLLDTWHFARGGGTLTELDADTAALVGGLQISDRSPDQDRQPYVPRKGRKLPGDGALPLREIIDRVRRAQPELPIGAEVLSEEVDDLGLVDGAHRIGDAMRQLVR